MIRALSSLAPSGERCRFNMEMDTMPPGGSS